MSCSQNSSLVSHVQLSGESIEFYDSRYPSMSDHGAYITANYSKKNNYWLINVANNGWSSRELYTLDDSNFKAYVKTIPDLRIRKVMAIKKYRIKEKYKQSWFHEIIEDLTVKGEYTG